MEVSAPLLQDHERRRGRCCGAAHDCLLTFPGLVQAWPFGNWAECMGVPAKLPRPGMSGMIGMALTRVANTACRGFSTRSLPSARRTVSAHVAVFSLSEPP